MPERPDPTPIPVPLDDAARPVTPSADGANSFGFAKFLTITVLAWATAAPGLLAGSPFDGACGVVCGAPLLAGFFAFVAVRVLNLTLATLGAAGCRRVPGARRAFAVAGCASVVASVAVLVALGFLLDFLKLRHIKDATGEVVAAVATAMFLIPTVAVDVASAFVLAKWGQGWDAAIGR
jgi:hypothetical protein